MPDPKHEILIVDDEDALRNSLALLLQSSGYHVTTAINGFDALLRSKIEVPAVVILT
jgi:CheY-like chemotaxis protein